MENEWVDFRMVKAQVSMQMLVDHYDLGDLRKSKDELRGQCPIHRGEGERTFHINLSKNVFQCFSCKAKGNVLDFVAEMEHCNIREAALKLQSWFAVGESDNASAGIQDKQTEEPVADVLINPVLPFKLRVDATHEYGLKRGLDRDTLELFGAGLCISKGTFSGRFVIPLHNEQGELVGFAGRSLDDSEPRYLFPSREKGFYKSHLLFNLHRVIGRPSPVLETRQIMMVLDRYDSEGDLTISDVVNELDSVTDNPSIAKAIEQYREEAEYDRQLKGRGDMDTAEENFLREVRTALSMQEGGNTIEEPVVLLEGFFGCFKVTQAGYSGISLLGSSLSKEQEELIFNHFKKVVLMFDGDDAGRAATDDCLQRLGRRLWVKAISLPDGVQPDQLSIEEIQLMFASL